MLTQDFAETECTLILQSQGYVASNMHNALVHFNGQDIVVLGHLWADWETQAEYILIFNNYYLSQCMRFPTMWHLTCVDSDEPLQPALSLETPNGVQPVA